MIELERFRTRSLDGGRGIDPHVPDVGVN
jgi:hypothetical protein